LILVKLRPRRELPMNGKNATRGGAAAIRTIIFIYGGGSRSHPAILL
jgi:hypothetical protein